MSYILYGDGIHDDTVAIQHLLDTSCEVRLPMPKAYYLISRPLELPSGCRLVLPRFARIRLADGSDCVMLKNKMLNAAASRISSRLFDYVNLFSPDASSENIEVEGGIWDFNNKGQKPNPILSKDYNLAGHDSLGFLFYNVRNLKISSMTLKDPVTFAVTLDTVSYFTVDNITFDFNEGNPYQSNMDGIHVCGHCHHGKIEKLFGTCYDDIVALNAEEGTAGPISDITVQGIYTDHSYSAVRLLSASPQCAIRNIHISDVHGTFYHFCISMQRHQYGKEGIYGTYENITLEHIYAAKSDRALVNFPRVFRYRKYPLIDMEEMLQIQNLQITDVHRSEYITAEPTIGIGEGTMIRNLILNNITSENHTDCEQMPLLVNQGEITSMSASGLYENGQIYDIQIQTRHDADFM